MGAAMASRFRIAAIGVCLALAACVSKPDMAAIEAAASKFHRQQASGDDAANYADAVPAFRTALAEPDFARIENAIRAAQGCGAVARDAMNYRSNVSPQGSFVTVVYNRTCASGGITETMTFQLIDHAPHLAGYYVAGMALFPSGPPTTASPQPDATPDGDPHNGGAPATAPAGTPT